MAPRLTSLIFPSLLLAAGASAQYSLKDHYQGSTFFNGFTFFTGGDPTAGFVTYVDKGTAQNNGLISTTANTAYIGVDYTSSLDPGGSQGGRQSVRLTSVNSYTEGLFILDASHMPGGICGTWPAWWTVGGNWPNNGEIDIIEGVNSATSNLMSLHTSDQCTTAGSGETGTLVTGNCYQYAAGQSNSGCGVTDKNANSYGKGFNANGGGVYAMEWTSNWIRVYFFPRNAIPADIKNGNPNPASWGTPVTNFQGSCNIPSHFSQHQIVFDTTFCGQWAGAVWGSDATCAPKASSCQAFVASNPGVFKDAYWEVNYVAVYQKATNSAEQGVSAAAVSIAGVEPTSSPTSSLSSVVPEASTDPAVTETVANVAAGYNGPVSTPVAAQTTLHISQVPATANSTEPASTLATKVKHVVQPEE